MPFPPGTYTSYIHITHAQANAYDDAATGEVVVDIIRVPKLYLTDTKGVTGSPIWCAPPYQYQCPSL